MKKSLLAKTVVLGLMTATIWSFACVASADPARPQRPQFDWPTYIVSHKAGVTVVAPAGDSVVSDPTIYHKQTDSNGITTDVHTGDKDITDCKEDASMLTVGDIATITETLVNNDRLLEQKINNISVSDTDTDTKTAIEIKQTTNADGSITVDVKQTETQVDVKDNNMVIKTTTTTEQISGIAGTGYVDKAVAAEKALREAADKKEKSERIAADKKEKSERIAADEKEKSERIAADEKEKSERIAADEKEKSERIAADKKEKSERIAADKKEKSERIAADKKEKSERIAADKKEKSERIAEDTRIEQKFDKEVSRLDSKIDKLDGRIEKVGAMSAAIANLHTMGYDPAAPTEIAVGVGQYRDKTGLAVGAFHYPNRDFMMSFSVSTAGDEFMAGIGATWKIGRKSPEQMLKAQQEKVAREKLAEAEAMKQAAKDARVAAQQARHAKMLAERSK